MNPMLLEKLMPVARSLADAGHGEKGAIKERACAELGVSLATLHKLLKQVMPTPARKKRCDAGSFGLTRADALTIAAALRESVRQHGKEGYAVCDVVAELRANGMIDAVRVDKGTGELVPLSDSAILRGLRHYGLHPEQLGQPTPHVTMASLHPNHVWQVDASLCVLYYLKPKAGAANGLRVMAHDEFYKNKPRNVAKIAANRVWSYEITDHASGWIYVEYVMGAESGENLCNVLMNAMVERGGADMLHGVPKILYMDPGSANTSAMAKNLCRSLGIQAIAHKAGNARATGQVEQARNIIERKFESGLRFRPVADLEELNAYARLWRSKFNATAVHTRHKMTRSDMWMRIRADQLVKAPSLDVMRSLAIATPEPRKVRPGLKVSFGGVEYNVSQVPDVRIGEKLLITRNPWRDDAAQVVMTDDQGRDVFHVVPRITVDEYGFPDKAPVWGEGYAQPKKSHAEKAHEELDTLLYGDADKKESIPFGGRFNPYLTNEETELPSFLPRRGTAHDLQTPAINTPRLTPLQIARRLSSQLGEDWQPEFFSWLSARYGEGATEDELDAIADALLRRSKTTLQVVGGKP